MQMCENPTNFLKFDEYRGRVVVITGAAQGIGLVTAMAFLENGAHVVGIDKDLEAISDAKEDFLNRYGEKVDFLLCDLANPQQIERTCKEIVDRYGEVHVL